MLARLNFLFAVSASIVIAFYVVGRFVLLEAVLKIAPALAPYFVAAFALSALMLTVLVLAKVVIRLESTSVAARVLPAGGGTFFAQAAICLAHACALLGVYAFFTTTDDSGKWVPWVLAAALYLTGIVLAIADWRKRAVSSPA